jgi:hypothetical protein
VFRRRLRGTIGMALRPYSRRLCRDCAASRRARRSALTSSSEVVPRCWLATACGTGHSRTSAGSAVHQSRRAEAGRESRSGPRRARSHRGDRSLGSNAKLLHGAAAAAGSPVRLPVARGGVEVGDLDRLSSCLAPRERRSNRHNANGSPQRGERPVDTHERRAPTDAARSRILVEAMSV